MEKSKKKMKQAGGYVISSFLEIVLYSGNCIMYYSINVNIQFC